MEIDWYYNKDGCKTNEELHENEIEVQVPFIGTYCMLNEIINGEMEREAEYWQNESDEPPYGIEGKFDLGQFCKDYVKWLSDSLGIESLKFRELYSPKYYNFETDKIFCSVDKNELWELYKRVVSTETYIRNLKNVTTYRDGYIPHFRFQDGIYPKIEDMADMSGCLLGLIIEAVAHLWLMENSNSCDEKYLSSYELMLEWSKFGDCEFYNWLEVEPVEGLE